ncbi:T9SS type A sorting domain-containing protein [Christiangramia sabulilitoris]|uniref:T9SS type A sorting domain-containing protein n=2 Tax=Christiangramia sabulilitoris TaxID=2583991 RepID=A0A550I6H9_9FLAO|nr:T9SS type A sorting domain-containing protein [Christiangramia sabulilitoris]
MNVKLLQRMKIFLIIFLMGNLIGYSQTSTGEITSNLENDPRVKSFKMDNSRGTPSVIQLNTAKGQISLSEAPAFLSSLMGTGPETVFILETSLNSHGLQVDKFQQYTKGIKVEHGVIKAISKNGVITAFTAEYYNLGDSFPVSTSLNEATALQKALDFVGASLYAWEYIESLGSDPEVTAAYDTYYPKGELVIVDDYSTVEVDPAVAYKFNVYAAEPVSRADIYVDANTGKILLNDAIIKHANGHTKEDIKKEATKSKSTTPNLPYISATGDTRYAGTRSFDTSQDSNGLFALKGVTPSGIENETFSYEGIGGLPLSIPALSTFAESVYDGDCDSLNPETADNIWNASEHRKDDFSTTSFYPLANEKNNDDVALDAHWGAEVVLDYWKNVHNRLSYDDKGTKVFNYVHYGDAYDNAFWNGSAMTYGDGSYQGGTNPDGSFAPLTSMDVCAHEIGHGVCEFTADLVYARESGAMNEGFSDIWAATVEHYVLSQIDSSLQYDPWGIGEQIDERDGGLQPGDANARALRWMDDPKAAGDPDSYGGENWQNPDCGTPTLANDQCGVHTNSGVLNKWFYFLVSGSGQSFSPGFSKASADDQVTDAGNSYEVFGLDFEKSAQIAYIAETMLSPNAKFAEMRETSILVAQTLFGIGSFEEEQTTNAWHAVDIGERYNAGEPNTITFSDSNVQIFSEDNELNGCEDFNTYSVVLTGVEVPASAKITLNTSGSTAEEESDFSVSTKTLNFTGSETKSIQITVYDDAVIEDSETIVLSFIYNGTFHKQEYAISDNDFAPRTGTEEFDLLMEAFDQDGMPADWSTVALAEGSNIWKVNGDLSAAGRAYISDGITDIPFYDQNSPSHTILRSSLINAAAASNVKVSFDWEAGGETDAVDTSVIFDYGEFVYSLDGSDYVPVQKFVGAGPLGVNTASGTFTAEIPELDGKAFFLGWRWYNDTNAGTQFSFAIDNVKVSAIPAGIETQQDEQATATVQSGNTIYFLSNTDKALIAKIENASADLGCVTMSVTSAGNSFKVFPNISTARPSKSFSISTENTEATYDLTIYFTEEELSAFDATTELIPLKVNSMNIDDADDRAGNFQLNGSLTDVNTIDEFRAYTGTFSGSGSISIVQDFAYCTAAPSPWKSADVGNSQLAGEICYLDGHFELTGSGMGMNDKADAFYFTYQEVTGDAEVIAKLNSFNNGGLHGTASVVIRETLDAGAKVAATTITANPNFRGAEVQLQFRKSTGGKLTNSKSQSSSIPQYIRIVRSENMITSYVGSSTSSWTEVASTRVNFGATVYVGIGVASGSNSTTTMADFSELSVLQGAQVAGAKQGIGTKSASISEDSKETKSFDLYPNPAVNRIHVEVEDSTISAVGIYNMNGQLMDQVNYGKPLAKATVDVSQLLSGMYILKVHTGEGDILNKQFLKK